jgi:Ca2+-dependent lipid-binding protein
MSFRLTVVQARNLPRTDGPRGYIDPYVVIRHGPNVQKTRIFQNNPNPVWNESFNFQGAGQVTVELWDEVF